MFGLPRLPDYTILVLDFLLLFNFVVMLICNLKFISRYTCIIKKELSDFF